MPDVTAPLVRNGVSIDATYAEAFDMRATALVITACACCCSPAPPESCRSN
jgi:formylmethanofuran:tetrahydromethanopterin formyltransferase